MGDIGAERSFILAAGGLLERAAAGGPQLAIVGRTRYADRTGAPGDWVLPKGKLVGEETLEQAALREVFEETGCTAVILGPAFESEHLAEGVPKLVSFFRMRLVEQGKVRDASEVKEVRWLTPREALACLTYEAERDVLRRAYPEITKGEKR